MKLKEVSLTLTGAQSESVLRDKGTPLPQHMVAAQTLMTNPSDSVSYPDSLKYNQLVEHYMHAAIQLKINHNHYMSQLFKKNQ